MLEALQPHETLAHSQSSRITNPSLDKDWRSGGATRFTMSVSRKGPTSACPIKSRANLRGGYLSALGPKQAFWDAAAISALPPKADTWWLASRFTSTAPSSADRDHV
jgi:hypothetical protein